MALRQLAVNERQFHSKVLNEKLKKLEDMKKLKKCEIPLLLKLSFSSCVPKTFSVTKLWYEKSYLVSLHIVNIPEFSPVLATT